MPMREPAVPRSQQPAGDGAALLPSLPVVLTLTGPELGGVARLVAAGVAMRLDLRFEAIDDLQTAIESVLRTVPWSGEPVTVSISTDAHRLAVSIGPVAPDALRWRVGDGNGIDLATILGRLVDRVTVTHDPVSAIGLHVDAAGSDA